MYRTCPYLNQILAFWLCDEWLEFWCGEGVDETGLGHDEKQHLGAREDREFVSLCRHVLVTVIDVPSHMAMLFLFAYFLHDPGLSL